MANLVERWETAEYKFRKRCKPISDLRMKIARILVEYRGCLANDRIVREIQDKFDVLIQKHREAGEHFIMPNSMRTRPEFWEYMGKTAIEVNAMLPPATYASVKQVIATWDGEYCITASYLTEWLDENHHFDVPDFLHKQSYAPLTCSEKMDFYLYVENGECMIAGVERDAAWSYALNSVPWKQMIAKNPDWEVARLCARLSGMLPWPRMTQTD